MRFEDEKALSLQRDQASLFHAVGIRASQARMIVKGTKSMLCVSVDSQRLTAEAAAVGVVVHLQPHPPGVHSGACHRDILDEESRTPFGTPTVGVTTALGAQAAFEQWQASALREYIYLPCWS